MNSCDHSWSWPDNPEVRALGLGVAALKYAELGYAVLPLERGGKKPHRMTDYGPGRAGGVHNATLDRGQIDAWWRSDPAANIGVACGQVSRLCVVDLDVKNPSASGIQSLADYLLGWRLPWPPGPVAHTPSGGLHYWLHVPEGAPVPERPGILPGTDVKGDGGYVVAAPSMKLITPDGRGESTGAVPVPYSWGGCPCAAPLWPSWMPQWLASAPPMSAASGDGRPVDLGQAAASGFTAGSRNVSVYRTACSLYRRYGTSSDGAGEVLRAVRVIWEHTDQTDFGWREVLIAVESARRFIEREQEHERALMDSSRGWLDRHAR